MYRSRPSDFAVATILAIETSCDETAVAVVRGTPGQAAAILSSEISSQIELHREHGGVVPELASRDHSLRLDGLVRSALDHARIDIRDVDAFAATSGPGLASSLLIGTSATKGMACALGRPFIGVNHLEGHLLSPFIGATQVPRHLALIVSGGHTLLIDVAGAGRYRKLGSTRDDAAGEAFDKVGKMLGLSYPGGPEIEQAARDGDASAFVFPRSMLADPHFDFSFSGLKTAVLYTLRDLIGPPPVADIAASFQQAVIDILVGKTLRAAAKTGHRTIAISGGVSLNNALRTALASACQDAGIAFAASDARWCTDNAAMIGFAALLRHHAGIQSPLEEDIDPNLALANTIGS
jgi:N6-L-threonylcarbamoyladenine synthase